MSATLHAQRCLDVLHANSVAEFKRQIIGFVQDLGFSTFGALVVTDHSPTLREFKSLNNAPAGYAEAATYSKFTLIDPVLQHCKNLSSPVLWDARDYALTRTRPLWEEQEPFGYRSGLAIGMHFPRGKHFVFGANSAKERCGNAPHFKGIAEDLLSFAAHAQAAAFELSTPTRPDPGIGWGLTRSELESLRWSMDGLSQWEIGQKMALSDAEVKLRLRCAMNKLACGSKYEAALKAIKLGLIECD